MPIKLIEVILKLERRLPINKNISSDHHINFQNTRPEYAVIQLSKNNIIKNASLWVMLFLCCFIFGFFAGYITEGKLDYEIVSLDFVISIWGFIAFLLSFWFLSYTRRYKYILSFTNYLLSFFLVLVFTLIYLLYKLEIFGQIGNSLFHKKESVNAIKNLFYTWLTFILTFIFIWYLVVWKSKNKYWYAFFKASILLIPLILYLFTPFLIINFNSTFDLAVENFFWIISLLLIISFSLSIGFLAKYETFGQKNLKIVNKVLGYELSYSALGSVFGALTYQIYLHSEDLLFEKHFLISISISLILLIFFMFLILKGPKIRQNSFFNKIILKIFTIFNLLLAIILVYISSKSDDQIIFTKSLEVIIPPFLSILFFYVFISIFFKLIIFELWTVFTNLLNFFLAFFFIVFQGVIATLEDGKILYKWLGSYLVIIIISFYAFVELLSFFPELVIVVKSLLISKRNWQNSNQKNALKEIKNV